MEKANDPESVIREVKCENHSDKYFGGCNQCIITKTGNFAKAYKKVAEDVYGRDSHFSNW